MLLTIIALVTVVAGSALLTWQLFELRNLRNSYKSHLTLFHNKRIIAAAMASQDAGDNKGEFSGDKEEPGSISILKAWQSNVIPPSYRAEDDDPDKEDPDLKRLRDSQRGFFS